MYQESEALDKSKTYFNNDELAASVFVSKYALRDNDENILECTPTDMFRRIAREFARIEKGKFKTPLTEDEIFNLLDGFKYIVMQGSPMFGIGNNYQYISLSNCFVLDSPLDSYSSIMRTDEQLIQISKRRGGTGIDLSHIRPAGSLTKNSSRSSTGIIPFMERYSHSIREVGQNSRRGALMITLDIAHPQSEEFATIKNDDTKVTGANISLRINDEFMKKVKNDEEFELKWPVDAKVPKITKMISARKLWNTIIDSAWQRAEPGVLFWDTVTSLSPADCYAEDGFRTESTNPCQPRNSLVIKHLGNKSVISTIGEIEVGDKIWSEDGWVTVVNKIMTGVKPVYKYSTASGYLECTENHRVLSNGDKIEVRHAKSIDLLETPEDGKPTEASEEILSSEYIGDMEVFDITVDGPHHTYWSNGFNISNCGELPLCPLDSCRLSLLNLYSYVNNPFTKEAKFDFSKYTTHVKIAQRLMDDLIDLELEKVEAIIDKIKNDPEPDNIKSRELELWAVIKEKCQNGRRTGLGVTALGDCLAALGIKYDSDDAVNMINDIMRTHKHASYRSSVEMAKELGPFPVWNWDKEKNNKFLLNIKNEDEQLYNDIKKFGRRNIANLTLAPCGSVSILTQTTSGIEPLFAYSYTRRKKINHADKSRIDFVDKSGDKWQNYDVYHPKIQEWMNITGETDIKKSPWYKCCANDIDWSRRVLIQSTIQKHIDHSISSTINLPENVTKETVAKIYMDAYDLGCKGVTVYRDNCRSGVLVNKKETTELPSGRPKIVNCDVHHIKVRQSGTASDWFVLVGLVNNKPYEVFAGPNGNVGKAVKHGKVTRVKSGKYACEFDDGTVFDDIDKYCNNEEETITRLVSMSLRLNAEIDTIVDQLEKVKSEDLLAFSKAIARALKKYIPDGKKVVGQTCPTCGNTNLVRSEGCVTCTSCGYSKCS